MEARIARLEEKVEIHDGPITIHLDNKSVTFDDPTWTSEVGWQYSETRKKFGNLTAILWRERFDNVDCTRITWALINGFAHTGNVTFDYISVEFGAGRPLYRKKGRNVIQVRGPLARRSWIGPAQRKIRTFQHIEPFPGGTPEIDELCQAGLDDTNQNSEQVGIYLLEDTKVYGKSSLNGSHGGWEIAPYHFSPEGWQKMSRVGYQWAEACMFNTLDRSPLASMDPNTLEFVNPHVPYWPGRMNNDLPGLNESLDADCDYLEELNKYKAHDFSHYHRCTSAPAMLAEKDVFARFLLKYYWHDIEMWLDGSQTTEELLWFKSAKQIMQEDPAHVGHEIGGRGLAHSVRSFLYAEPYLSKDHAAKWRMIFQGLLRHIARPNGIMHSQFADDHYPGMKNAARAREVSLMQPNLAPLGLHDIAEAANATMARLPDGTSVSESFDSSHLHWADGVHSEVNYYPLYDHLHELPKPDVVELWHSPNEQALSLFPCTKKETN